MSALTLTIAQKEVGESLLVIEGSLHEDEDGNVSNGPIILGKIIDNDRLKAVAELILNASQDVAIEGKYSWTLVTNTSNEAEQHLWSICWITSELDFGRDLPEFLCHLTAEQIESIVKQFPNPSSGKLLDLARCANEYFYGENDDMIQATLQNYVLDDGSIAYDDLIDAIAN